MRVLIMSGTPSTKMTVVYVKSTGHIVAAVTRTNASGPSPTKKELVGDGIRFRLAPNGTPTPVATFVIPVDDLDTLDLDAHDVGATPLSVAINLAVTPSGSTIGSPQILPTLNPWTGTGSLPSTNLTTKASPLVVNIPNPPAPASLPYYVVVSDPLTVLGFPATTKGTLAATGNTSFNLTITNLASSKTYAALVLVQGMLPYVTTFST